MRKIAFFVFAGIAILASCTKKTENTIVMTEPKAAYVINGVHDLNIVNQNSSYMNIYQMNISLVYNDSAQNNNVTLSLSALPPGVTIDTSWQSSGIPPFSASLIFYDTSVNGVAEGTYPMTLTATSSLYGKKTYAFNINVTKPPSCTEGIVGKYANCTNCTGSYTDSIYNDANFSNKIWFANFAGKGVKLFGVYMCTSGFINIPTQTVNGVTYQGNAYANGHTISGSYYSTTGSCSINMQ